MIPAQPAAPFQSASLYVGDLHSDVTEGLLFELFNRVGPVASIRVCRDAVTRRSLGYAYVNFHNVQDAERALDTMNFTDIKGRPCRIMWSQRDPSLRKSGVGNVFVKNLAPSVDNKGLFDTFSVFGNILSCKVATDENGASKGYGYVHYETAEAAQDAIQKFNGNFIEDMEVFVGSFVRRQERAGQVNWTNLYVKQYPPSWDEAKIREVFSAYGTVVSVFIVPDAEGKSKGFAFVNYAAHESADNAVKELANKVYEDPSAEGQTFELYVNRAQKKVERNRDIKTKMDALKEERVSKYQGMNLYVKNLDDTISDELFRETFAKYGTITSARIMREADNASKGFGFICYSAPEEAARAVAEQNGKIMKSKPLIVTLHQRKDLRRAHLAATYAPRSNMRFPAGPGQGMPLPYNMPMYVQPGQGGNAYPQQRQQQQYPFQGQQYPPRGGSGGPRQAMPFQGGRGNQPQQSMGGPGGYYPIPQQYPSQQMQGMPNQQQYPKRVMPNGQPQQMQQIGGPGGIPMQQQGGGLRRIAPTAGGVRGGPQVGGPGVGMMQGRGGYMNGNMPPQQMGMNPNQGGPQMNNRMLGQGGPQGPGGIKFNNNVRNQAGMPQQQQQTSLPGLGEPLDDQALAQADPQMQKNMIGERLYPLIYQFQPELAGKITGMLLEMDNAELLNLIESPDALSSKIDEALVVLKNHRNAEE